MSDTATEPDPADSTVLEILEIANRLPAESVERILAAERSGKARASAISGLERILQR